MRTPSITAPLPRIVLALALSLAATGAGAQNTTLRCPDGLVELGDTTFEVRAKCGEPTHEAYNLWIYDFGPGQFQRRLEFADEVLVTISIDEER